MPFFPTWKWKEVHSTYQGFTNLILAGLKSIERNWVEFKRRGTEKVKVPCNISEHEFCSPEELLSKCKMLTMSLHKDTLNIVDEVTDL